GINSAVPGLVAKAVDEHKLRVIGPPDVDLTELTDGEKISLTADIEVRPELALPDFSSLTITVDAANTDTEAIDAELTKLQERFATLKAVERPATDGDHVGLDLLATADGEHIDQAKSITYKVGSGDLLDGLDDAVRGSSTDDEVTFQTTLAGGEHAGKTAQVTVNIRSIKEQNLPALDDEFAQSASEFDSLDELRDQISEQLERRAVLGQAQQARERAVDALLEAVEVPLPQGVVTREIENNKQQLTGYLDQLGMDLAGYLGSQGKDEPEFDESLRGDAEKSVRAQLVLDAVVDAEELGITDTEITTEVVRRAQRSQVDPQQFADHLVKTRQLALVAADVRREKALTLVVEQAVVTDTSGVSVHVAAALAAQADAEPATVPVP
ncbi:MAG: trigger factor, partial [Mycobacteriales bacterium]